MLRIKQRLMKKLRKDYYTREMVRPILHMAFTRFILALTASLVWNEFANRDGLMSMRTYAFLFVGIFFLVMAWMAYLRLDGYKLPTFDRRLFEWKRKPKHNYGDMSDYVDEDVQAFDEFTKEEQDRCRLAASLLCAAIFLLLALL